MLLNRQGESDLLCDVLPNCLLAMEGEANRFGLPPVRGCVVVLVDGLGARQLRGRSGHARTLFRAWGEQPTLSSFPSTTAAGITALTTATLAGMNGMVGYSIWDRQTGQVRNQLSGLDDAGVDPASWQLQPTVFEQCAGEIDSAVVSLADYRDSGLTRASLRGATYIDGATMRDRSLAAAAFARKAANPLIYCYHAELDQAGHKYGWESDRWLERLEELDAALVDLVAALPRDIGVLVVADHGMVDIDPDAQLDFSRTSLAEVVAVAGEPRFRHLYVDSLSDHPSATARVASRMKEAIGDTGVVATKSEAFELGWYGPQIAPNATDRIGDVLVAATADVVYYTEDMPARMREMVGHHGSITPSEVEVPCVRLAAFA